MASNLVQMLNTIRDGDKIMRCMRIYLRKSLRSGFEAVRVEIEKGWAWLHVDERAEAFYARRWHRRTDL